jgi:hypothetical protein
MFDLARSIAGFRAIKKDPALQKYDGTRERWQGVPKPQELARKPRVRKSVHHLVQ